MATPDIMSLILYKSFKLVNFLLKINRWAAINTTVLHSITITFSFDLESNTSLPITTMKLFLVGINWMVKNKMFHLSTFNVDTYW